MRKTIFVLIVTLCIAFTEVSCKSLPVTAPSGENTDTISHTETADPISSNHTTDAIIINQNEPALNTYDSKQSPEDSSVSESSAATEETTAQAAEETINLYKDPSWIYPCYYFIDNNTFYGLISPEDPVKKFIKIQLDTNSVQYYTENTITSMLFYHDWIYFKKENGYLYRMRTEMTQEQQLTTEDCQCYGIYKDKVYYCINNTMLCRMNPDGTEQQCIKDNSSLLTIHSDRIYYRQNNWIYSMGLNGEDQTQEYQDIYCAILNIQPDELYYFADTINGVELHEYSKENNADIILCVARGYEFDYSNGYFYYISNDALLHKMLPDSSSNQIVYANPANDYHIFDQYIVIFSYETSQTQKILWIDPESDEVIGQISLDNTNTTSSSASDSHDDTEPWQPPYDPDTFIQDCRAFIESHSLVWTDDNLKTGTKVFNTAEYKTSNLKGKIFEYIMSKAFTDARTFHVSVETDPNLEGEYNIYVSMTL